MNHERKHYPVYIHIYFWIIIFNINYPKSDWNTWIIIITLSSIMFQKRNRQFLIYVKFTEVINFLKVWGQPVQVRDVCVLVVLVSIYQEKIHAKSGPKVQRRHKWTMLKLFIIDTWISKDLFFRNTWLNVSKWRSIHSSKKQAIIKKNQFLCYHNSRGDGIGFLHWQIIFFFNSYKSIQTKLFFYGDLW